MPLRYIPAVIVLIALIGAVIYSYQIESSYIKGMNTISGELVALGDKSTFTTSINEIEERVNTQAIVDFEVNNSTYTVEGRAMGYPRWKLGKTVEVYFSESNPSEARINRWDEIYFFTLIFSFFLSCCTFFCVINFVVYKVKGRPLS